VTRSLGDAAWCSGCRRQNGELAQFCRHCGARLRTTDPHPDAEATAPSGPGSGSAPAFENTAPADFPPQPPLWSQSASSPVSPVAAAPPLFGRRRRAPRIGAPWHSTGADEPSGRSSQLRWAAIAIVAVIAVLVLAGWQAHWPAAVFGAKAKGAAAGAPSSRTGTTANRAAVSPAPSAFPTTPSPSATNSASPASTPPASGPAATVDAYFAAITVGDYTKAWQLGGQNLGPSYAAFVSGFQGTAKDTVTILSVAGDVVTARLLAYQTDGTVKTYQGTYTVQNGEIAQSNIQQVG
jgi:hypothetical protein